MEQKVPDIHTDPFNNLIQLRYCIDNKKKGIDESDIIKPSLYAYDLKFKIIDSTSQDYGFIKKLELFFNECVQFKGIYSLLASNIESAYKEIYTITNDNIKYISEEIIKRIKEKKIDISSEIFGSVQAHLRSVVDKYSPYTKENINKMIEECVKRTIRNL